MRKVILFFFLLLLYEGAAQANLISNAILKQYKINPLYFQIDRFAKDSSILFGLEKITDPNAIMEKGGAYIMRLLILDPQKSLAKVESIHLPIQRFHQIAFSNDTTMALLSSESGANLWLIDIQNRTIKKLFGHKKGAPGFRVTDPLLYFVNGHFYAYGYFYDENDFTDPDTYLVRLNLAKSSAKNSMDMFEKTLNLREVRNVLGISSFGAYLPPDRVVWGVRRFKDAILELKLYDKGKAKMLDAGIGFTGVVHAGNRIFYVVKKPGIMAEWNAIIKDLDTNKTWNVGEKNIPYTYHFISNDGTTVTLANLDFKRQTINYYFARREYDFRLQPIGILQNVPFGTFRLSPDGKLFAYYNPNGILIDFVK